jgi:AhpD family alkylhydroperoxidase
MEMEWRLNYPEVNPEVLDVMMGLEPWMMQSGLDKNLYELIKLRASQINGCSYCIDRHAKSLLSQGEPLDRVLLLPVWKDVPSVYSDAETVALELTEAVTRIAENGVPDELYERVRAHYDEKSFLTLVMAINVINCWNRISLATGMYPGCTE